MFATLCAIPTMFFAQRNLEYTNESWTHPNLSVEVDNTTNRVISAFTDRNPATQATSIAVKTTDLSLNNPSSFFIDLGQDVTLMDFTVNTHSHTLFFTGFYNNFPDRIFIVETTQNGAIVKCGMHIMTSGWQVIPHQIIYSENVNSVVITGTMINGVLNPYNTYSIEKKGFIMSVPASDIRHEAEYTLVTNSPLIGSDADMLENIVEIPGSGYVATGSGNNISTGGQNLRLLQIDYYGNIVYDNLRAVDGPQNGNVPMSNSVVGASVLYKGQDVYVLVNNSAAHQFQIAKYDPAAHTFSDNFFYYHPYGFDLGNGIDMNGFKLENDGTNILVSGYISGTIPNMTSAITPFLMSISQDMQTVNSFSVFGSGNQYDLTGYFAETGPAVYINTPDIMAVNAGKAYIVNPNYDLGGYDLIANIPSNGGSCGMSLNVSPNAILHTDQGFAGIDKTTMHPVEYGAEKNVRAISQLNLCRRSASAHAGNSEKTATVYPNPVKDELTISLEEAIQRLRILDVNGALVRTLTIADATQEEYQLPVGDLQTGVYLIEITNTQGIISHERFVKE